MKSQPTVVANDITGDLLRKSINDYVRQQSKGLMSETKVRGQVIEDRKSQWSNIKRQGSVIDETSKNQSHQDLLRKLKAQYRSPRSQHGRMFYQYNKGKGPFTNNVKINSVG